MKDYSLSQVSEIYSRIQRFKIIRHNLTHPELKLFANQLQKFRYRLNELDKEEYWRQVFRSLNRIRFLLCSAPLTQRLLVSEIDQELVYLQSQQDQCRIVYPDHAGLFGQILSLLKHLPNTNLEKQFRQILDIRAQISGTAAILICAGRFIEKVEQSFSGQNIEITSAPMLKDAKYIFDLLFIVGPCPSIWYPEYVLTSPRATTMHIVKFSWLKEKKELADVFVAPMKSAMVKNVIGTEDEIEDDQLEPDLVLPDFDYSHIIQKATSVYERNKENHEFVEARICNLEGEKYVFLDLDSEVLVINPEDEESPIERKKVGDLGVNLYILLRTTGGGDYIVPIADRILAEKASALRSAQKGWKNKLRSIVAKEGVEAVASRLNQLGSRRANYSNLRNWMSYRSIKTEDISDFSAIVKLIDTGDSPDELWEKMRAISSAHSKAGFYIRELLLSSIKGTNFTGLIKKGIMQFNLPDEEAGNFTAFRITGLSKDRIQVSPADISIPFEEGTGQSFDVETFLLDSFGEDN